MVIDDLGLELLKDLLQLRVADVVLVQWDSAIEVGSSTHGQVVNHDYLVALRAEAVGDVRADEPGPAGN